MNIPLEIAIDVAHASVRHPDLLPASLHIVTDTRVLEPGDVFLALRGERHDGHRFAAKARDCGAAGVIVDEAAALDETMPALIVADTRRAYMVFAAAARSMVSARVVAITGSSGKTTTKHFLAELLARHYGEPAVLASPANENNEIGVSKLLLNAAPAHRALVIEMGARHDGEIAELVGIADPHIGILTNIGEAHLETFGTRECLARTKWGLFSKGALPILNVQDAESLSRASGLTATPMWFGAASSDAPGVFLPDSRTLELTYGAERKTMAVDVRVPGVHNRANLAAAVAAALVLGVPEDELAEGLSSVTLPLGRYQTVALSSGARIIYDAYNANVSGTIAALDAFALERADRRIAVLASMAELGSEAMEMHERVGAHAASVNVDMLLVGGDFAHALANGAATAGLGAQRIVPFQSNKEAAAWIREHAHAGDAILLKGSRKYRMEEIVEDLYA